MPLREITHPVLLVDEDNQPVTIAAGGDASAANQATMNAAVGAAADSAASTDTGTFAVIPLLKRALQHLTTSIGHLQTLVSNVLTTVAHDAADSGNPIKWGTRAIAALSGLTLVAADDRSDAFSDLDGALLTRPGWALGDIVSGNASNTDGASTQVIATAGAGIKQYLTHVILTNTSAADIYVEMKSATTVKATIPVPKGSGASVSFNPPLPPNAANEAWNFDPSAATTTVYCTAVGFKSKI